MTYVNEIAGAVIASAKSTMFPSGAIIVREKLASADSKTPELLAIMIKREKGFNPSANDWEFLVLNRDATKVQHREKKGDCQQCHAVQKDKDFVFRESGP